MKKYLIKNHLGLAAILISICIPVILIFIQHNIDQEKITKTYYFANTLDASQEKWPAEQINCWVRSIASNRSDAFRCMSHNMIYDPCFRDPFSGSIVVCPNSPSGTNNYFGVKLKEEVLQQSVNQEQGIPWYVKLYDGRECRFITGATLVMADRRMDYGCDGYDETDNFLLLPIVQEGKLSKIGCMIQGKIDECEIEEAWY